MKVNFNNVRKQAIYAYENLVKKLNNSIINKDDQYAIPNDAYHEQLINIKGYVLIDAEDIQKEIDDLRMLIGTIAMTNISDNEEFKDMFQEVFPNENDNMICFNEEI